MTWDRLFMPNAWDLPSAAALAGAGFPVIGTTSLGVASVAGLVDGAGLARSSTLALARLLTRLTTGQLTSQLTPQLTPQLARLLTPQLSRLPVRVSVDIEGGFSSSASSVADFCAALAELGVVGVNIEDGDGPPADLVAKVRAVKRRVPSLFVNARTDLFWLGAGPLSHVLARVAAYREAGADGVFVPGLPVEHIPAVVQAVDVPVNVLYDPYGPSVGALFDLGAGRVSTGSLLFRASLGTTVSTARSLAAGAPFAVAGLPSYREVQRWAGA